MRNRFATLAVMGLPALLTACSSGEHPAGDSGMPNRVEATIGTDGGHVELPGGPSLDIPAGAFDQDTRVVVEPTSVPTLPPGMTTSGDAWRIEAGDGPIRQPILVSLPVRPELLPAGASLADVDVVGVLDGTAVAIPSYAVDGNRVLVATQHLSTWSTALRDSSAARPPSQPPAGATYCPLDSRLDHCFVLTNTLACPDGWHATAVEWQTADPPAMFKIVLTCEVNTLPTYDTIELGCRPGYHLWADPQSSTGRHCEANDVPNASTGFVCASGGWAFNTCQLSCPAGFVRTGAEELFADDNRVEHQLSGISCMITGTPWRFTSHCQSQSQQGCPDGGTPDASAPDASAPDAGTPDAGAPGCTSDADCSAGLRCDLNTNTCF